MRKFKVLQELIIRKTRILQFLKAMPLLHLTIRKRKTNQLSNKPQKEKEGITISILNKTKKWRKKKFKIKGKEQPIITIPMKNNNTMRLLLKSNNR